MKRTAAGMAVGGVLTLGLVAACSQQQLRDLEGVPQTNPDKVRLVTNLDRHPNIAALCINGVGFATTTRDRDALTRVEEWDAPDGWCGAGDGAAPK